MKIKGVYTSVWDDSVSIHAQCTYDTETHEVACESSEEVSGVDLLTDDYVTLKNGVVIREEFVF